MTPSSAPPPTPPIDLTTTAATIINPAAALILHPGVAAATPAQPAVESAIVLAKKPRSRTPETFVLNWQGREVRLLEIILDPDLSWQAFRKQNNNTKFFYQRVTIS